MPTYHVHLFAVVRYCVPEVAAADPRAAIGAARLQAGEHIYDHFESPETDFAEEYSHFLVDLAGDEEFRESRWFYSRQEPLVANLERLIAWHDAGGDPAELQKLVAAAREVIELAV